MKYLEIVRTRQNKEGIIGILSINNTPECVTLEPPWKDNKAFESCVPAGIYQLKRIESPKYGDTFEIQNVQDDRKHCIIHPGNRLRDTLGCVLTGTRIGFLHGELAILDSKKAYEKFLHSMGSDKEAILIISNPVLA